MINVDFVGFQFFLVRFALSSSSDESESELDELESESELLEDDELLELDELSFPWALRFSFSFRAISSSRFFFISFFISFVRESLKNKGMNQYLDVFQELS